MPTAGWIGGPGTTMAVLNRNPLSRNKGKPATPSIVFLYELKRDLNLYLRDWATGTKIKTMADIVAFNEANADKALRFGQDLFLAAEATRGDLSELRIQVGAGHGPARRQARAGIDAYMSAAQARRRAVSRHARDAAIAAKAGYPSVQVPAGFIAAASTARRRRTIRSASPSPAAPGARHKLLRLAYAYEQASKARRPPPGLPAL